MNKNYERKRYKYMAKRREIRNSTAEFLIFQLEGKEHGIEVYYKDKTVWCTQKAMGVLFDCTSDNISVHLQNIYDTDELKKEATTEKISVVRRSMLSSVWGIVSIVFGQLSSVNGLRACCENMLFVVMCWIGNVWRMVRF